MTIWRAVRECEVLPRGYGVAWVDAYGERAWCLPVPLHRIAGLFRRWWHALRAQGDPSITDRAFRSGYRAGRWRDVRWAHEEAERIAAQILRIEEALRKAEK